MTTKRIITNPKDRVALMPSQDGVIPLKLKYAKTAYGAKYLTKVTCYYGSVADGWYPSIADKKALSVENTGNEYRVSYQDISYNLDFSEAYYLYLALHEILSEEKRMLDGR